MGGWDAHRFSVQKKDVQHVCDTIPTNEEQCSSYRFSVQNIVSQSRTYCGYLWMTLFGS